MDERPVPDVFDTPFFAAHSERRTVTIDDNRGKPRTYTFPTFFTHSPATMLLFTADEKASRSLLPPGSLAPVRVSRGRCLFAVACYRYGRITDGMVGYNELALGLPVSTSRVPLAPALLRRSFSSFGVYVLDLPVDSEENCHRGVAIWGLPKSMKAFRYQDAGGTRTVEVAASGKLYFRLTFARGGRRTLISEMNQVYSVKDGRLQVCRSYLDGAAWQYTRLSPLAKRTRLELGDSGVPAQLKALDIDPRPLVVRDFDSLNTVLYLPEAR